MVVKGEMEERKRGGEEKGWSRVGIVKQKVMGG